MEWRWLLPLARYGNAWRQGRKLLDRSLGPGAAATYRPMQQARVRVLLTRLLATPNDWKDHIELCETFFYMMIVLFIILLLSFQGELILDMTYGYEVKGRHDRKLDVSIQFNKFGGVKLDRFAMLIDRFPFRM